MNYKEECKIIAVFIKPILRDLFNGERGESDEVLVDVSYEDPKTNDATCYFKCLECNKKHKFRIEESIIVGEILPASGTKKYTPELKQLITDKIVEKCPFLKEKYPKQKGRIGF